jgi:hypothetical protein
METAKFFLLGPSEDEAIETTKKKAGWISSPPFGYCFEARITG